MFVPGQAPMRIISFKSRKNWKVEKSALKTEGWGAVGLMHSYYMYSQLIIFIDDSSNP